MSSAIDRVKPPAIEAVVEKAMGLSQQHLTAYAATRSRHDFTQRQLMTCLLLRDYLQTTFRGVLELLAVSPTLRQRMGLVDKLPHFTTLQKFSARDQVEAMVRQLTATIGSAIAAPEPAPGAAAMDAIRLAGDNASGYWRCRTGNKPMAPAANDGAAASVANILASGFLADAGRW